MLLREIDVFCSNRISIAEFDHHVVQMRSLIGWLMEKCMCSVERLLYMILFNACVSYLIGQDLKRGI